LEGQDGWVKAQIDELLVHFLLILLDEAHEHFLVDEHTHHHREVLKGQIALHDHGENPKGFFLTKELSKSPSNKVHALAIPDGRVSLNVGLQYALQRVQVLLLFKERVCRKCTLKILLYIKRDLDLQGRPN
jgi:hypothetical protein